MKLETAEFLLELPTPYDIYFYSLNYFGTALTKEGLASGDLDPNLVEGKTTKAWRQFRVSMDFHVQMKTGSTWRFTLLRRKVLCRSLIRNLLDNKEYWKQNVDPFSTWHGLQLWQDVLCSA